MNIRETLSDAGISVVKKVSTMAARIILIPVIINFLGTDSYGIWVTVLSFVGLTVLISEMHLHGALIRYIQQEDESQTFVDILFLTILIGVSVGLLLIIIGKTIYLLWQIKRVYFALILPTAVLIAVRVPGKVLFNFLRAKKEIKRFELVSLARSLSETLILVPIFWQFESLSLGLWGLAGIMTLFNGTLILVFFPKHLMPPNISNFRKYIEYGAPMVPKEAAGKILHSADKFLLLILIGPTATGVYAVGYNISSTVQYMSSIFDATLYPRVTSAWDNKEYDSLRRFYSGFFRWYTILVVPAIVGLALVGSSAARLISTPQVAEQATPLVPILAIGFAFQGVEFPLSYLLAAAERTRRIATITLEATVLNILTNILLIPYFGLLGAAIATMISYGVRSVLLYQSTTDYIKIEIQRDYFIKSVVAATVMCVILLTVPLNQSLRIAIFPILGSVIFFITLVIVNGVSEREKDMTYEIIRQKVELYRRWF